MTKKTLYLDCFSGIAGDMTLAALIDLGADIGYIVTELEKLPIDRFEMEVVPVVKRGISAKLLRLSFDEGDDFPRNVHIGHHGKEHKHEHHHEGHGHHHEGHGHHHEHHHEEHGHHHAHHHHHDDHEHGHAHHYGHVHAHAHSHDHEHRKAADIIAMIEASSLPRRVKERSVAIFRVIAEAEGRIHGMPPEDVHFHEVGAMDSIIDIIGVCLALENLGVDELIASPVPAGSGRMKMVHGLYPLPAPATLEILRGIPLSALQAEGELTTPTGAGIVRALAARFGPMPPLTAERIGYGAGMKDFAHPNILRAVLMTKSGHMHDAGQHGVHETQETITVLETQLDDSRGELFGYMMDRLFAAGALDVYYTPIYMKKNRPGILITVLANGQTAHVCEEVLFAESSTFGVRRSDWTRRALGRQWRDVQTRYGTIRVKLAVRGADIVRASPEYEEAAEAARRHDVPLQRIYEEVQKQLSL